MTVETGAWLNYAEAAKRVKSSERTVKRWRREGMLMEWDADEDGQWHRVVEESVLLAWWRQKMQASPVHQIRLRKAAIERVETPPPMRKKFTRSKGVDIPGTAQDRDSTHDSDALRLF